MNASDLVVVDTMVVSAMVNAHRDPVTAAGYRRLIDGRSVIIFSRLVVVQPHDGFDDRVCRVAGPQRTSRRRARTEAPRGRPVDRRISALHLGVDLVSDDSVFQNIDGLTVLSRPPTT